jgi:uncharacterized surface protein with fasciclin (FAS1) repeats
MTTFATKRRAVLGAGLMGALAACASQPTVQSQPQRAIMDVLASDSSFERFVAAAGRSGAAQTLAGPGPFTVFAFTNSGWDDLPVFTRQELMTGSDVQRITAVMNGLIVEGRYTIASMAGQPQTYTTRNGTRLAVDPRNADRIGVEAAGGSGLSAGIASAGLRSARVVRADVEAANGVIHVLSQIIVP